MPGSERRPLREPGERGVGRRGRRVDRRDARARRPASAPFDDRIDAGLEKGLTPGVDPEATPACVNACIADALAFGDADDPASNVSRRLAENQHFRMHEELGTGPGFFYLWDRDGERAEAAAEKAS